MGFPVGEVLEYRDVKHGRPWWRTPARVVADADDVVALWWPPGTKYQRPRHTSRLDVLHHLANGTWELEETEWWGGDALMIVPADAPFAIWPYRTADGDLIGWYCNLQAPLVRAAAGFEADDWTLDVVASPDLSGWMWKDEDELVEGERLGLYSPDQVTAIRAAGREAVALIERRDPIFEGWADWRPDPAWGPPPPLDLP